MYGIKGIRWAIKMAPTPEQTEQIKQHFDKLLATKGRPSGSGVLFGLHEEHLLTVDEALEMFQQAKIVEDNWPHLLPAPKLVKP
jgi:hypothetical protein